MDQQNPSDVNSPAISPAPPPRCQYRTATGRQCRSIAVDDSTFCARHDPVVMEEADLSARLSLGDGSSRSANGINQSLANLFTLLAQDRIAPRRAAVLAYITSLLLRSIRDAEEQIKRNPPPKLPVRIFWGPLGGNRVQIIPILPTPRNPGRPLRRPDFQAVGAQKPVETGPREPYTSMFVRAAFFAPFALILIPKDASRNHG